MAACTTQPVSKPKVVDRRSLPKRVLDACPLDRVVFVKARHRGIPVVKAGAKAGKSDRTAKRWEAWRKAWLRGLTQGGEA